MQRIFSLLKPYFVDSRSVLFLSRFASTFLRPNKASFKLNTLDLHFSSSNLEVRSVLIFRVDLNRIKKALFLFCGIEKSFAFKT